MRGFRILPTACTRMTVHEILNETDRDQVMADIAAWLNVHVEL